MSNSHFPAFFKDKISIFFNYFYATLYSVIAAILSLSLFSFDIKDSSFITNSSLPSSNLLGDFGSYIASFIFYTFGILGFGVIVFFIVFAVLTFIRKKPSFIFIRLFFFLLSLILIPQTFYYFEIEFEYIDQIEIWGLISDKIYSFHQIGFISYSATLIGIVIFIFSQNLFSIKKLNFFNNQQVKKRENFINKNEPKIKKEPIMNFSQNKSLNSNKKFLTPSLNILNEKNQSSKSKLTKEVIQSNSNLLEKVFFDFNIEIKVIDVKLGPVITLYEILPAAGIKINTIINLASDISRSMGVGAVRISQIYGTQYLGVEVPNEERENVTIKDLLSNEEFKNSNHKIPICIGKDISGKIEVIDLSKTPHLLVAGTTGSGKSVFINTILTSLLYKFSPESLRLILIDPKMLELSVYNDIAHLMTPVVTEPKKSIIALKWVCKEMERRYSLMNEQNTRNLEGYNEIAGEKMPYIVVVIDEMADLMMTAGKEVEHYVQRLAQMARACGIHLIMATQRPSVDIITGSIKANFPSRISFQVASKYDSRTVLGEIGAEQLLGNGDMLMSKYGGNIIRYQSAFITDKEVNKLINEVKKNQTVKYLQELDDIIKNDDENFDRLTEEDEILINKSIDLIKSSNKASTSYLQRNFQIGYNKAARIMEALEKRGVVSEPNHAGKREILIN